MTRRGVAGATARPSQELRAILAEDDIRSASPISAACPRLPLPRRCASGIEREIARWKRVVALKNIGAESQ